MDFGEKLQELRKSRGLTQEELAQALFVSRTAVSKWESGRGYPSIDSLKEISKYFSVTIDDLLSGEKLLSIAETENRTNIRKVCAMLMGMADLFSFLLIVLPLYPKTVGGFIYSVNLLAYGEISPLIRTGYWCLFAVLILLGGVRMLYTQSGVLTYCSLILSAVTVLFLALAGETYAVTVAFLLLTVKVALLLKCTKTDIP
jgi:transcriptional regulator with XRE-family HTH domain